mmetsp:Transcript_17543/g.44879  ORF Transcript_17543/g.44879 Transcript_17543/m.44879 type:complete len:244 (-) Transcript_17543:2471-3202(-)
MDNASLVSGALVLAIWQRGLGRRTLGLVQRRHGLGADLGAAAATAIIVEALFCRVLGAVAVSGKIRPVRSAGARGGAAVLGVGERALHGLARGGGQGVLFRGRLGLCVLVDRVRPGGGQRRRHRGRAGGGLRACAGGGGRPGVAGGVARHLGLDETFPRVQPVRLSPRRRARELLFDLRKLRFHHEEPASAPSAPRTLSVCTSTLRGSIGRPAEDLARAPQSCEPAQNFGLSRLIGLLPRKAI